MEPRPWYRKKRYLIPAGLFAGVFTVGAMAGDPSPVPAAEVIPVVTQVQKAQENVNSAEVKEVVPPLKQDVTGAESETTQVETQAQTEVQITTTRSAPIPEPESEPEPAPSCNPNYSGCLKPNASDYDCAGGSGDGPYYTGAVQVLGYDQYKLDRDGDGWACE